MGINFINNKLNIYKACAVGDYIIEYSKDAVKKNAIHLYVYNPADNTYFEIMPDRVKYNSIGIVNGIWNCRDVYYSSYESAEADKIKISVYKYSIDEGSETKICYFSENRDVLNGDKRINVFILSETAILLQTETQQKVVKEGMMGNIEFRLALCNLENGEVTNVNDPIFINNGISTIVPLSDNKILIKTGFSYIDDERLEIANENEALIESIYITTTARLIADVMLANDSIDMELIESTYFDRHITKPQVHGNYIHFSIINVKNNTTKCIFINHETKERLEYSINDVNLDDIDITYVRKDIPYVRKQLEGSVNFVNLKKAVADISFYNEEFIAMYDDIIIVTDNDKAGRLNVYSLPELACIFSEKTNYRVSCTRDGDYYIYCQK